MTVRAKSADPSDETIKAAILDAVAELFDEHLEQINGIRDTSETKSIVVNFSNEIDCSESQAVVTTRIKFSQSFTDRRTNKIEDGKQGKFETIENAGRGGRKRGDKAPSNEPAPEPEAA